jgi:hypothetical protein
MLAVMLPGGDAVTGVFVGQGAVTSKSAAA